MNVNWICQLILNALVTLTLKGSLCFSFSSIYTVRSHENSLRGLWGQLDPHQTSPTAALTGYVPDDERPNLEQALQKAGFLLLSDASMNPCYEYSFSRATGMLQLRTELSSTQDSLWQPPRWIPVVSNMENILVANGWSFLDPDENEELSAFDVDAANREGQYKPKWGNVELKVDWNLSKIGFVLQPMTEQEVAMEASKIHADFSFQVLLEGGTDPPYRKQTQNGYQFAGSVQNIPPGLFLCAIGGLPLFTTTNLSPSTASSGWLSFSRPISDDHIIKIFPKSNYPDQRIEVICAKSRCHLGHYFGPSEGYCINASALNFVCTTLSSSQASSLIPSGGTTIARDINSFPILTPHSWRSLEQDDTLMWIMDIYKSITYTEALWLGAGCFWHVEAALRRLPGIVSTTVGYTGGMTENPTYKDVCQLVTGHAEVVQVVFDPNVLNPRVLLDCFFAMHDPTKVRAHGKRAQGTGQYRSCIILKQESVTEMKELAQDALDECQNQLGKDICTVISYLSKFWAAEERHQRHNERRNLEEPTSTLDVIEWIEKYGKRSATIVGSATTITNFLQT
jgi:peptide-methionine (S)-S-oxide reductase